MMTVPVKFERAMAGKMKTKHYYSTHNVATRVGFGTAKDSHHGCVVRIFIRAVLAMNVEESDRAMVADGMTKALISPPPR